MVKKKLNAKEALEFLNQVMVEQPLLPFLIPLGLFAWFVERWVVPFSNWVPLVAAVWATIQYGRFKRRIAVEDLNKRWKHLILNTTPNTPIEPCEWLNKLLIEVWPNYMEPKLARRFRSTVERRLKNRKPKLIDKIELQEFLLGSCPPTLGNQGMRWMTSGDQLLLIPILDGEAILYSFESTPEVRIGVAFGSGGSQAVPGMELPGVSTWLVKLLTETIVKTMVEPRRLCFSLPSVDLKKRAVGGVLSVTVVSASYLGRRGTTNELGNHQSSIGGTASGIADNKVGQMFIEVEVGNLMRKTTTSMGPNPTWNSTFNMVLHGETGAIKFMLYELDSGGVKFNYLTSCEIKVKYVLDGSTIFWAIGHNSGVVARHAEHCGKEVGMAVPFEDIKGESSSSKVGAGWIELLIIEAKDLVAADLRGTSDPYVRVLYGNNKKRTKVVYKTLSPYWNQTFEFAETGEPLILHVKDHNAVLPTASIGHCTVEYSMLPPNQSAEKWIPLQGVRSGEIRVKIARRVPDLEKRTGLETDASTLGKGNMISTQMRDSLKKCAGLIDEGGDTEALSLALTEVEGIQEEQEAYIQQLEREKAVLLRKIQELGSEIIRTSSCPPRTPY